MMNKRKCNMIIILIILIIYLIYYIIVKTLDYDFPPLMVYESDVHRYFNVSLKRRRIPLIIHQTYQTHEVPSIWNSTVNTVIEKNQNIFQYRRWSHDEMSAFVKEKEPKFYSSTYIKYSYEMQR